MMIVNFIGLHTSFVLMFILTLWFSVSAGIKHRCFSIFAMHEKTQLFINALAVAVYVIFFCAHNFFHPESALTSMHASIFFFIMAMLFECLSTDIVALKKIKFFLVFPSTIFIGLYLYKMFNPYLHTYTKFYLSHLSMIFAVFTILTMLIVSILISSKIVQQSFKNIKKYF